MIRAVLDTNIIVSALFWGGLPGLIFVAARNDKFVALSSADLENELEKVLHRVKFANQLARRQMTVDMALDQYRAATETITPVEVPSTIVRDPKDRIVLACAVGGDATYIVSGDNDLLALSVYKRIRVLTAAEFLERLKETDIDPTE